MTVAFDTLKLAQRLEAAGFPAGQAQQMASALGETIGAAVVTREFLDLRLAEMKTALARDIAEGKAEILKWMIDAIGLHSRRRPRPFPSDEVNGLQRSTTKS